MRGNLDTRLRKLERGDCEALVLAAAGVHRLGLTERITSYFSLDQMCPAVGQGALGIEIRADDPRAREAVARLDHLATHQAVRAERAVLRRLGGGCQVPIAAHAVVEDGHLRLQGLVANLDGTQVIRAQTKGPASDPEALGAAVAEDLLRQGAREILDALARRTLTGKASRNSKSPEFEFPVSISSFVTVRITNDDTRQSLSRWRGTRRPGAADAQRENRFLSAPTASFTTSW